MIDEPILSEFSKGFVETLLNYCDAPAPEPAFVNGLEQQLLERQATLLRSEHGGRSVMRLWQQFSASFARRRWQYTILALFVALAVAVLAIGPQRVLAQVQRWLGYVPGIGFVDLAETRVLASPAAAASDGITLRVEQVIAGPQRTQVLISSSGFSEKDLPWPNEAVEHPDFTAFLLLPDGSQLEATRWELNIGHGKLEFPALPSGVYQLTLLVPRLPLVPSGALPEDWEIPLTLRPANGALIDELFPHPYSPTDASDTQHGITLRVLDVAQTSTETAIHYQVEWTNPEWEFRFGPGSGRPPELRDDLGHIYWESPESQGSSVSVVAIPAPDSSQPTPTPAAPGRAGTLAFPALSLSASRATLWIDALEFRVPAEGSFSLNLGDDPQIGDAWPLDVRLEIADFPTHLTGARLREETVEMGDGRSERRPILEFDLDPLEERDGFSLDRFDLSNPDLGVYGSAGRTISNGIEQYKGRLEFTTGKIPSEGIELQVTGADLLAHGPWEATWTIPGRDEASAAPVHLYPQPARQTGDELQPVLEEIFLSDRLTALEFGAVGLPPQASFVQVMAYNPAAFDPYRSGVELYLEDNWGRRYEPGRNQAFIRPAGDEAGYDPRWRFFPPLEPLAQSVTLHVPGMEIYLPGQDGFIVEVPQDLAFKPEQYTVTVMGGGGPERQETQIHYVSDPWAVDIPLELAGYQLRFTQAQLEHDERADPPYRLLLTGVPPATEQDAPYPNRLRFSEIERPDGQILQIDPALQNSGMLSYPSGGIGLLEPGSSQAQAVIGLDVTAADRVALLAGRYRVELNGVTAWAPGPWELSFSLSGH